MAGGGIDDFEVDIISASCRRAVGWLHHRSAMEESDVSFLSASLASDVPFLGAVFGVVTARQAVKT